jgi:hypothetical protein
MRLRLVLPLVALPIAACDCGDDVISPGGVPDAGLARCADDMQCGDRMRCVAGACIPRDQCSAMVACPEGRVCMDRNGDGFNECVFPRCQDDSECSAMTCANAGEVSSCTDGACQCGLPCRGGCPSTQGCCLVDQVCYDLPERCMGLMCPPGQFISVTSSGAWDQNQCMFLGAACHCERLPPLPVGDVGLYSALAHDGASPVVSAYDLDYGDLVFGTVQPDGVTVAWEFVDGVPTTTTSITGDVDGPRGGNSEPGDDVGIYTDLAADALGRAHIAYVDRDKWDLKYALGLAGTWRIHTVATEGDTGLYASIALDAMGRPRIAYLGAREDTPNGDRRSVLRVSITATTTPTAVSDWTTREIETVSLSQFECADRCRIGEVCRAADFRCVKPDVPTRCTPLCSGDTRCLNGMCTAIEPLPPFRDLPKARGLWPSIGVLPDQSLLVAYHDRIDLSLKLARIAGPDPRTGAIDVRVIEGGSDEVGLYPSLFVTPAGEIHLAYVNATRRSLVYRLLDQNLQTVSNEVVETGIGMGSDPDGELIGADPALVVDAQGVVRIAYQDATAGDLKYARRMAGGMWTLATLRGTESPYMGSFGFYNDQIIGPDRRSPLVSTYRFFLSAPMGAENGLVIVTPP